MAFNLKRNNSKRLPANSGDDQIEEIDTTSTIPGQDGENSNVVATQAWVYKALQKFWKWTKFFATESLQVAGGIHAGRVKTCELQTNDLYANRLNLVDGQGRLMTIYVNDLGELVKEYDYQNVFVYPGSGEGAVSVKNYVYRYDKDTRMADNFIGLTPYETLLNFIPFRSSVAATLNDIQCPMLCAADKKEQLVDWTLLFTCPNSKRITGLEIWDKDGLKIDDIELPEGTANVKRLTINMPGFKKNGDESAQVIHVALPEMGINGHPRPFIPPFLFPPRPQCIPPMAAPLSQDIFDEPNFPIDDGDDIFSGSEQEGSAIPAPQPQSGYEVVFENYVEESHANIILKNSDFAQNQKQFLHVKTEAV